MERLSRKRDRAQRVRPVDVTLLADQRVTTQPRLDADLIALAGDEPHFDQRRPRELFDHLVMADRLLALRVARVRFLLNQRFQVPDEVIAPDTGWRRRVAVHDRLIDALRLTTFELLLQRVLSGL